MYFLASCDFILVSLSCSLPVCQKQRIKKFFTAHAELNVYMCSKNCFLQMKKLITNSRCRHRSNLPGMSNQWKSMIGKVINQPISIDKVVIYYLIHLVLSGIGQSVINQLAKHDNI